MQQTYFNRAEKHCGTEDDEKDNIQGKKLIKPGNEKNNNWGDSKLASNSDSLYQSKDIQYEDYIEQHNSTKRKESMLYGNLRVIMTTCISKCGGFSL